VLGDEPVRTAAADRFRSSGRSPEMTVSTNTRRDAAGERTVVCRPVTSAADVVEHHRIRHTVFVEEQRIFEHSDADRNDTDERTYRILGLANGIPAGAVRLYPLNEEATTWQGDRLAVLPGFRTHGLGAPLVRYAVTTAASLGGRVMLAHTQLANVRFFERLGCQVVS
jgi:putative N-acetyltransferase (TIGR04045 family)